MVMIRHQAVSMYCDSILSYHLTYQHQEYLTVRIISKYDLPFIASCSYMIDCSWELDAYLSGHAKTVPLQNSGVKCQELTPISTLYYLENGGRKAIITDAESLEDALDGKDETHLVWL